ncbi:family 43 glycosylhydrolase [Haloprofundus salinisoli]|uniref:family 43 glycosylhydrolase n=1 Tax=Haloprofundus salinisoli TaxID=2876193 RepID=UPI001CCD9D5F|nr:family 43 glycosylhydrolase [Haloprofundus salinisoli]
MFRRTLLRKGAAALAAAQIAVPGRRAGTDGVDADAIVGSATADTVDGAQPTYRNPVHDRVFADPAVVRGDDGGFYAYGTYNDWGSARPRRLIPILRSENLVRWTYVGEALRRIPAWRGSRELGLWAPDVRRIGGRYVLYYSLTRFGDDNPAIGAAVAETPGGPFEDRGRVLQSDGVGLPNTIDPCPYVEDGTPYLLFGSHRGIYGVRLTPNGLSVAGDPFQITGDGVEAAYVVRRNGRYYLFGSRGTCCDGLASTYHLVVGRADSLRGPYRNRAGNRLLDAPGTTILRGDDTFAAPGHNAVVVDDSGDWWLVYHAYKRSNPWAWSGEVPRRVLMLDQLAWNGGWPTVPTETPSRVAPAPTVDR